MYSIYCVQVRNKYAMLGYAYNAQKMELTIIEEGSMIRRLSAGSRMCGEYILMCRESEWFRDVGSTCIYMKELNVTGYMLCGL